VRSTLASIKQRVAAISPLVGGKPIKGPADKMMRGLGHEVSPLGIARLYRDCVGTLIIDQVDRKYLEPVRALGMNAVATDTIMTSPARAAVLADVVLRALEVYP
jgi:LPPG:FO 2-phospho-L-lactate transferase